MLNLGKYIVSFFLSIIMLVFLTSNIFASSNPANSGSGNPQSAAQTSQTNPASNLNTSPNANVESLDQINYGQSGSDYSTVINIILIAVGLVIILLAIAILIRLKR